MKTNYTVTIIATGESKAFETQDKARAYAMKIIRTKGLSVSLKTNNENA